MAPPTGPIGTDRMTNAPSPKKDAGNCIKFGEFLARLKAKPDLILTSPLPRASQTADIAAEHLLVRVHEERLLGPGFAAEDLKRLLR